jgi:4-diphosphocytidyl-2-C-methyl-D-erythritol kinase
MRVRAFAKINLSLRVLGRRSDGYHELRTVFQSIALHDTLRIRRAPGPFRIECNDPACPTDQSNLIWRAAEAIWRRSGRRGSPRDVMVSVTKRIPVQSGLGGGSSDCAAALTAFARLWSPKLAAGDLRELAMTFGADVPFFFEGGTVLGLEKGDMLFPLVDEPPCWVALVIPPFGVSTRDAYGWWDAANPRASSRGREAERVDRGRKAVNVTNDLQPLVAGHHPAIARLVASLRKAGATHASMSGSGSAVFGLFSSRAAAARASSTAGGRLNVARVTRTLNRPAYQHLAAPELPRRQPIG